MHSSLQDGIEAISKSGLLTVSQLAEVVAQLGDGPPLDGDRLYTALIERQLITPWHRAMLLQGKLRGFVHGHYRFLDHLGAGAMGAVFLAEHRVMGRQVAVKFLPPRLARDPHSVQRFLREAEAIARLNHPNIVQAFDVHRDGQQCFLVLEYVPGDNLAAIVGARGPLGFEFAAECLRQAADGLAYMHDQGVVHRDIKPSNLLVGPDRRLKILDLGLARSDSQMGHNLTDEKTLGTTDYMAPEQAVNSHNVDSRADIYSLGCTMFFLLTGRPPFDEGGLAQRLMAHQSQRPPEILQLRPGCPPELAAICGRMLEKDPADRYQSAAEVRDAIGAWLQGDASGQFALPPFTLPLLAAEETVDCQAEMTSESIRLPEPSLKKPVAGSPTKAAAHSRATLLRGVCGVGIGAMLTLVAALCWLTPPRPVVATAAQSRFVSPRQSPRPIHLDTRVEPAKPAALPVSAPEPSATAIVSSPAHDPQGLFVAVGGKIPLLVSTDGHDWTDISQSAGVTTRSLVSLAAGGGRFVAVGMQSAVSGDGWHWEVLKISGIHVAWLDGRFVVVCHNGQVLSSPDGKAWQTAISISPFARVMGVARGPASLLVWGENTQRETVRALTDGAHYLGIESGRPEVECATCGPDGFYVFTKTGLRETENGGSWTTAKWQGAQTIRRVTWGQGRFLAFARDGEELFTAHSDDGLAWRRIKTKLVTQLHGSCQGRFFAGNGDLASSPDGVSWTFATLSGQRFDVGVTAVAWGETARRPAP